MKKTVFQIAIAVMLLMMGCSKDELIKNTGENNQLKKGRVVSSTIEFYSASTGTTPLPLAEVGGQILKSGEFSGNINGYGEINSNLSTYEFTTPVPIPNTDIPNGHGFETNYFLSFNTSTAKIVLAPSRKPSPQTNDWCTIQIIRLERGWNLYPMKWGPDSQYGEDYLGGNFIGGAEITDAGGKLESLKGKKFRVERTVKLYDFNLSTGYMRLHFIDKEIL